MVTKISTLQFVLATEHPGLVSQSVFEAFQNFPSAEQVGVTEIDPELSDTAAFCEQYEVGMEQAANCVVLEAKRADKKWLAACVILGSTRADVNGVARRTLGARKVSFAPMELAVEKTGMEYGAITPIGLPAEWPILIDAAVASSPHVIIGSGVRKSKLALPGSVLAKLPGAEVIDDLAK